MDWLEDLKQGRASMYTAQHYYRTHCLSLWFHTIITYVCMSVHMCSVGFLSSYSFSHTGISSTANSAYFCFFYFDNSFCYKDMFLEKWYDEILMPFNQNEGVSAPEVWF